MDYNKKMEIAAEVESIKGHPLQKYVRQNKVLTGLLEEAKTFLADDRKEEELVKSLVKIREVAIYYAEKGDLLYPLLKVKYEVSGPSDLMWTSDDEIRDEFAALVAMKNHNEEWYERVSKLIKEVEMMIYKDEHVLFPMCAVYFTEEEWIGIYQDSKDYPMCLGVEPEIWELGEKELMKEITLKDGEIVMPGGHMTVEQLTALLNVIPMEITFVDDKNRNRFFNEGPKVFKRPGMAIDREVFSCHPPKVEEQVRRIIEEFRAGTLERVPMWMEKNGRVMMVTYMAVRDKAGKYLGTVELVQDMEEAKEYFQKKTWKEEE